MKKNVLILTFAVLLLAAGAAFAHGHRGGRHHGGGYGGGYGGGGWSCGYRCTVPFDGQGRAWFNERHQLLHQKMPSDILNKLEESGKLRIEIRAEMNKSPRNDARINQLRDNDLKLRRQVSDWYHQQWMAETQPKK